MNLEFETRQRSNFYYTLIRGNGEVAERARDMAMRWMFIRDFKGLKERLKLPQSLSIEEVFNAIDRNYKLAKRFSDVYNYHIHAYAGEMAIHQFLGNDWRLVFKHNDPYEHVMPDGYLRDGTAYDVYTRVKNRYGLSKKLKEDVEVYVLTHYYREIVWLVGYATLKELKAGTPEKGGRFSLPINKMHPVAYLRSNYRLGLREHVLDRKLYRLQELPYELLFR